jgi:hypothetical protein
MSTLFCDRPTRRRHTFGMRTDQLPRSMRKK